MRDVKLRVHRSLTATDMEGIKAFHRERSKMIHGVVDTLGLEVKDWGRTSVGPTPRRTNEYVDILLVIATQAVAGVLAGILVYWLTKGSQHTRVVVDVELVKPSGTTISIRGMPLEQVKRIIWSSGTPAKRQAQR